MSGTRRKAGALWPQVEGYRDWLAQQGYTQGTIRNMLKDLGHLGRWLAEKDLNPANLYEQQIEAFRSARQAAGGGRDVSTGAMALLLNYLRETVVIPEAGPSVAPLDVLLTQYRTWMIGERGLADTTVLRYERTARRFLQQQCMLEDVFDPAGLSGADVNAFLLRECSRVSSGSAKGRVAELRSILRFLYLKNITKLQLGKSVSPVGGWRLAHLPAPAMTTADVQLLLGGFMGLP